MTLFNHNSCIEESYKINREERILGYDNLKTYELSNSIVKENLNCNKPSENSAQTLEDKISEDNPTSNPEKSELIKKIEETNFGDEISELYADLIQKYPILYSKAYETAKENNFDPALLMGLATIEGAIQQKYMMGITEDGTELKIENSLNKSIRGVCQIGKSTWQTYGKDYNWDDMYKYEPNMTVAIRTLKAYLKLFDNELNDALVAYNLGPGKALNVKNKYANGKNGEIANILNRWVSQGFDEYKQPAYYPRRILESACCFRKVLEEIKIYDNLPKYDFEKALESLPVKREADSLILHEAYDSNKN